MTKGQDKTYSATLTLPRAAVTTPQRAVAVWVQRAGTNTPVQAAGGWIN